MSISPTNVGGASASPAFTPPLQSPSKEETKRLFGDLKVMYSLLLKDFYFHDRIVEMINKDPSEISFMFRDNLEEFKEILSKLQGNTTHKNNLIDLIGRKSFTARDEKDQESYDNLLSLLGMKEHLGELKAEAAAAVTAKPLGKRIQTIAKITFSKNSPELKAIKKFHALVLNPNSDKGAAAIAALKDDKIALDAICTFIKAARDTFKSALDTSQIEAALKAISIQEYVASLAADESVEE